MLFVKYCPVLHHTPVLWSQTHGRHTTEAIGKAVLSRTVVGRREGRKEAKHQGVLPASLGGVWLSLRGGMEEEEGRREEEAASC